MTEIVHWLATSEWLSVAANLVTVVGFPIAVIGLIVVGVQMKNDGLAVSAGAIGDMRTSIMSRVDRIGEAVEREDEKRWEFEFAELANDLEMACAIYLDGQMSGRTGDLGRKLIFDVLKIVDANEDMRKQLETLQNNPDTFKNIREFKARAKR